MQMRVKQLDDAEATIGEMEGWIEERYADADEESHARRRDEALIASLRTTLWIDRDDPQKGIEWLDKAIELDEEQKSRIPLTYIRLIRHGFYKEALPLIQRDVQAPVRSDFWLGYVHHHLDDEGRAKREWTKAIERDITKPENQHIMELILSRYYLGDPAGEGLSTVLQILNEKGSQYWAFFFLAGLGWAMRDNATSARSNFETAMLQRRSSGEGRRLPIEAWQYCQDLLDEGMQINWSTILIPADTSENSGCRKRNNRPTTEVLIDELTDQATDQAQEATSHE